MAFSTIFFCTENVLINNSYIVNKTDFVKLYIISKYIISYISQQNTNVYNKLNLQNTTHTCMNLLE